MKKFLAIFVAMLLLTAACVTTLAADPESYIWLKWDNKTDNDNAPSFQIVFGEEELSFLETGKQYKVFAKVYFSAETTGNAYFNFYAYESGEAAAAQDWDYLNTFQDFASSQAANAQLGTWAIYESPAVNFGIDNRDYRGDGVDGKGADVGCRGMTIGVGFWNASGEVRVAECGIMDAEGNVIYSKAFDSVEGLKCLGSATTKDSEGNATYEPNLETKGTLWGVEGEKVVTPPTEDAPTTPDVDNPETGDMTMVFALIALVSIAGATVVAKKRG